MIDKAQLIKEFDLSGYTAEEQDAIYEDFTYELGAAISEGLADEQMEEFTQIINGNEDVIAAWLAAHEPGYREEQAYKDLQADEQGAEPIPADKVYASIAWIKVNRPDFESIVARTKREFRQSLDTRTSSSP